jgi:hypothetical protein
MTMIQTALVTSLLFVTHVMYSQEAIPAAGGEATGGGTVSYSIGQSISTANTGSNGSVSQGVQQSIELIIPDNPNLALTTSTYPNPTADYVVLVLKDLDLTDLSYAMYDMQGRIISKEKIQQEATQIGLQNLAAGTYILMVSQRNQGIKTFKVIKE